MEHIKLVLCDLDGTLLDDRKEISEHTIETIEMLKEAGIRFGICTGRSPYAVSKLLSVWGIEHVTDVIIGLNGNLIFDRQTGEETNVYDLDGRYIDEIMEWIGDEHFNAVVFDHYEMHAVWDSPESRAIAKRNLLDTVIDGLEPYKTKTIGKLLTTWDPYDLDRFMETRTLDHPDYYMVRSTPTLLEFMDRRVSKGQGIDRYAQQKGIRTDEILSFGDEMNDADMLDATVGVALKNANPALFEHADHITTFTNNEDGVARFLEEHVLNEK